MLCAAVFAACNDDDDPEDATPSPQASSTVGLTESPTPTIDSGIRDVDLEQDEHVRQLASTTGGAPQQEDVWYADLTGDGVEEAVVPLSSEGTAGDLAVVVLTPDGDATKSIFEYQAKQGGGLAVSVNGDQLVLSEPAPGPDDPECCPTNLRTVVYEWQDDDFAVISDTTSPNPEAGNKTPVSP